MTELLSNWHIAGLTIGICTFLIIGIFHPIIIKSEYYFGVKCRWIFLVGGIICLALSVFIKDLFFSTLCGVLAFTLFWSIKEINEQRERVKKGWFPKNPKRNDY
jgi:hypothetical protein